MPEYLAPGVFVEEVSYRSKSIEGVSTTTTGFIGPTRYGPVSVEPELITGMADYERVYGDGAQLAFANLAAPQHNFMWHAARAFFENGGKRSANPSSTSTLRRICSTLTCMSIGSSGLRGSGVGSFGSFDC